ncbi:MAG: elongation factor Ts, partial [Acidobacteria bacterium]|nr:elongation factor Ts [Acidobacteriota bacterium]
AKNEGKPEKILDKIVEGRLSKFYEEVCLIEQPFIKDNGVTVTELIAQKSKATGGAIEVAQFVRFKVGETQSSEEPAAE